MGKTVPSEGKNGNVLFTAKAHYVQQSFKFKGVQASQKNAHDFPVSSWMQNPLGELKAWLKSHHIRKFIFVCHIFSSLNHILTIIKV